ncbi:MAG: hypothetical protein V1770_04000 [bacterium]
MKPDISKIKLEFAKLKKSLNRLLHDIEAIFILFLMIALFFSIYMKRSQDSIIDCLPDNVTAVIHFSPMKSELTSKKIFIEQLKKYFEINIPDTNELLLSEATIIFLQHDGKNHPILILLLKDFKRNPLSIEGKKNNLVQEQWNEKFLVLTKKPEILKNLNIGNFKHQRTLKLFKEKNSSILTFYFNLEKIEKLTNLIDTTVLKTFKQTEINEIFIGMRSGYESNSVTIADASGLEIASAKLSANSALTEGELILSASIEPRKKKPLALPRETDNPLSKFEDTISKILPSGQKVEVILLKNLFAKKFTQVKYLHDHLMLNGEKSPYYYILSLQNIKENEISLENLKNMSINYLDEIMPEEKTVTLPDGTYMTELWSNPLRFEFIPGVRGSFNIWNLSIPTLNFEFAYAKTLDNILLSNSKNALSDYLISSKTNLLNCSNATKTGRCPDSTMKIDDEDENFYINIDYLKNKSEIFKMLSEFGDYAEGVIME